MDQLFVSNVQKELQSGRFAVRDFVHINDLLRQFFRVFLFEDPPRRTVGHDLDDFIAKGILRRVGLGRGVRYEPVKNCTNNVPNVPKLHPTI